jgi:FkbM family methyltransferase
MQQLEHVDYTRNEWKTVTCFIEMINFLKDKNIEYVADIGSNVGEVSKIFLEELSSIKTIYAYEPQTENYEFLKSRFSQEKRMKPIKKCIFYGASESKLYNNGGCGSYTIAVSECDGRILQPYEEVEIVEIEEENIPRLDLAKLDVEGAEYNILKNTRLLKNTKYLIIEFHPFGMSDKEFEENLPPVSSNIRINGVHERIAYIKNYTDSFVKKYLSNYKIIIEQEEQYLLELM